MNDEELLKGFEACHLPSGGFHHREHVRVAWLYLRRYSLPEALARFSEGLRRFASAHGKPGLYHETITWAYIFLINERAARPDAAQTWDEFARANPDLLDWKASILKSFYSEERLGSEAAKRMFLFPDKCDVSARSSSEG